MIEAYTQANENQRALLDLQLENKNATAKVEIVSNLFRELGIDLSLKEKVNEYYQLALQRLNAIDVAPEKKESLHQLAQALHSREF
jgi:geranylgeranyl pyrophosphate synthase